MKLRAVIPAAGAGKRFGSAVPKQYLVIGGLTVMQWTINRLTELSQLSEVIVAVHHDDETAATLAFSHPDKIRFTTGGAERSDSVLAGLRVLDCDENDWVLVHDAARPCLVRDDLEKLVREAGEDPVGGLLALPVRDTLKHSFSTQPRVRATLPRDHVWQAQTPQMFRYGLLRRALETAAAEGRALTDESSAIEHLGFQPLLVAGSPRNIKITYPEDLELATYFLSQ
ncbi:MAG TPA: 2-C-methyl-D-erythritol 4-phosphate cytidylyltransferase [Fluviicoccus sp.]|nr:2-C-methyl-D-erythritol 4-phosphate cytidylyltransferase [Fluviicoccus sp.]